MYHFVTATALSRSIGSQWQTLDLSAEIVSYVYTYYTKVYLTLTLNDQPELLFVDMAALQGSYAGFTGTITEMLEHIGNLTIPTVPALPNTTVKRVKYSDAFRARYKVRPCKMGIDYPVGHDPDDLTDIEITRPDFPTPIEYLHTHCLVTINGFIHQTATDGEKVYALNARYNLNHSVTNHVGIMSFLDVGELTKHNLLNTNLYVPDGYANLKDRVGITLPEPVGERTAILVLGGYMVFCDPGILYQTGPSSFALDLKRLPYLERLVESEEAFDQSSLGLDELPQAPGTGINVDQAWSDATIRAYFDLRATFMVLVDHPRIATNKIHIRHSSIPGLFTTYQDPSYPMIVNYGKLAEYWKTYEDGVWSVRISDRHYKRYTFADVNPSSLVNVTSQLDPEPNPRTEGFLLEISAY